jgi:hypothetical protein
MTTEGTESKTRKRTKSKRNRKPREYPACSFEEALFLGNSIQRHAPGVLKVRRLTIFDQINKSPDSGASRMMITNSNAYGITTGGYQAEYLELTEKGALATSADASERQRVEARIELAIETIDSFKFLYDTNKGNKLPSKAILADQLRDNKKVHDDNIDECVDTFIVNAKFVGILRPIAGAERIIPKEQALEALGAATPEGDQKNIEQRLTDKVVPFRPVKPSTKFDQICFYITPIGKDGSVERKHSDLFLGSIVEPALEQFNLEVIRADRIEKPGMITSQIIEYIMKARLVVADLSFHNPNVFYELALRHAIKLPTVQVIQSSDPIPFDLDQFRTVKIDCTDIYTLVPQLQTYRAEIANQVRSALENPESVENPVTAFCPGLKVAYN